jgi:hypothetical protein
MLTIAKLGKVRRRARRGSSVGKRALTPEEAATRIQAYYRGRRVRAPSRRHVHKGVNLSQLGYQTKFEGATVARFFKKYLSKDAMIRAPPWLLLLTFFTANTMCVALFALFFYWCDEACFTLSDGEAFSYRQMLWLSIHTFTTVGYGGHSPRGSCSAPQLLVFAEHFVGLLIVAVFTAVLLSKVLLPDSFHAVRFSDKFVICDSPDGHRYLQFRLVRLVPQQLRDADLVVYCGLAQYGKAVGEVERLSEHQLELEKDHKSSLETWFAQHRIDDNSPLAKDRFRDLAFLNVRRR